MALPDYVQRAVQEQQTAQNGLPDYVMQTADAQRKSADVTSGTGSPWQVIGEPVLNAATGLAASSVGGLVGAGTLALGGTAESAADKIKNIQEAFTYIPRSDVGKKAVEIANWPLEKATEGWGMIGEVVGEQFNGEDGKAAGKALGEGGFQALNALALGTALRPTPPTAASLTNKLNSVVEKQMGKAKLIKPKGRLTNAKLDDAYAKASEAVQTIVKNKDAIEYYDQFGPTAKGRVPKNLTEFGQAIAGLKKTIYEKYNRLRMDAEGTGASVPLDGIIRELDSLAKDRVMQDNYPALSKFADRQAKVFKERGAYTPGEAQELIAQMNKELDAYNNNPNPQLTNKVGIKAIIKNQMQKALDDAIEGATGAHYQQFKNEYGALKSIEHDVNLQKLKTQEPNKVGLLNFYDVYSAHDLLSGALTGDVLKAARGGMLGTIGEIKRMALDPNRHVKTMFSQSDKLMGRISKLLPKEEARKIVTDFSTDLMRGVGQQQLPPGQNVLALPAPDVIHGRAPINTAIRQRWDGYASGEPINPQGSGPVINMEMPYQSLYEIATTPEGKQFLIEKFGRDASKTPLLKELLAVPDYPRQPVSQSMINTLAK